MPEHLQRGWNNKGIFNARKGLMTKSGDKIPVRKEISSVYGYTQIAHACPEMLVVNIVLCTSKMLKHLYNYTGSEYCTLLIYLSIYLSTYLSLGIVLGKRPWVLAAPAPKKWG